MNRFQTDETVSSQKRRVTSRCRPRSTLRAFDSISECFALRDEQKGWEQPHPEKKGLISFRKTVGGRTLDDQWAQHWPATQTPQRVTALGGRPATQPPAAWMDRSLCLRWQDFVGRGFPVGCACQEQAKRSAGGPRGRRYQLTVLLAAEPTVWPVHSEGILHLSKRLNGWKPGNSSLLEEDGPAEEEQSGVRRGEAEDASLP